MKKILFVAFAVLMTIPMMADYNDLYVYDFDTKDSLGIFIRDPEVVTLYTFELTLTRDSNRIYIIQPQEVITVWYGPDWDGWHSYLSDEDGYCWWHFVEFEQDNTTRNALNSTSGTNNHVGLVFPKGTYRISMHFLDTSDDSNTFVVERLPEETALDNAATTPAIRKTFRHGQLIILNNGVEYNAQGAVL